MATEPDRSLNRLIGDNRKQWEQYLVEHGPEAYRYRRLYEEATGQLIRLQKYVVEQGLELPSPGPGAS